LLGVVTELPAVCLHRLERVAVAIISKTPTATSSREFSVL
jgi:hypothetical protein